MGLVKGWGNPEALAKQMYQNNPEFKKFVDENNGLSNKELSNKYNIPL